MAWRSCTALPPSARCAGVGLRNCGSRRARAATSGVMIPWPIANPAAAQHPSAVARKAPAAADSLLLASSSSSRSSSAPLGSGPRRRPTPKGSMMGRTNSSRGPRGVSRRRFDFEVEAAARRWASAEGSQPVGDGGGGGGGVPEESGGVRGEEEKVGGAARGGGASAASNSSSPSHPEAAAWARLRLVCSSSSRFSSSSSLSLPPPRKKEKPPVGRALQRLT